MKLIRARVATTHIDQHNERMTREALEDMARQIAEHYIPVMWNHDIRHPPLGRIISAEVVPLEDGKYALETTNECWEQDDTPELLRGDGRSLRLRIDEDYERFVVRYDRTFLDDDGWALVQEIAALSGTEPCEEGKKALEPVSVLAIAAGCFVVGSIASGFFNKLGSDLYDTLKAKLKAFFKRNPKREVLMDFEMAVQGKEHRFEVHVLVDNATPEKIEDLFARQFEGLDQMVEAVCQDVPTAARIVLEWGEGGMLWRYVVTSDGLPFTFRACTQARKENP